MCVCVCVCIHTHIYITLYTHNTHMVFPHSSVCKESAYNAGDLGSIPGLWRCPGEGNGNPLQYSCLENPMDREAWQLHCAWGRKSRTWLSDFHFTKIHIYIYIYIYTYIYIYIYGQLKLSAKRCCRPMLIHSENMVPYVSINKLQKRDLQSLIPWKWNDILTSGNL